MYNWNEKGKNMINLFNDFKKKFGSVVYRGVELALTQVPYPDGPADDWYFRADAMDKAGNLWHIRWDPIPDVDECLDLIVVVDWDNPDAAEMVDGGND